MKDSYLSDEAVEIAMSEVLGEDHFFKKLYGLDDELKAILHPVDDLIKLRALHYIKLTLRI